MRLFPPSVSNTHLLSKGANFAVNCVRVSAKSVIRKISFCVNNTGTSKTRLEDAKSIRGAANCVRLPTINSMIVISNKGSAGQKVLDTLIENINDINKESSAHMLVSTTDDHVILENIRPQLFHKLERVINNINENNNSWMLSADTQSLNEGVLRLEFTCLKQEKIYLDPTNPIGIKRTKLREQNRKYTEENGILSYWCKAIDQTRDAPFASLNKLAKDDAGNSIVCRHLSAFVYKESMKDYHTHTGTVENIGSTDFLRSSAAEQFYKETQISYIFSLTDYRDALLAVASKLDKNESKIQMFTYQAENSNDSHMVVVGIKRNNDNSFTLKYYDPNITLGHKRFLLPDIRGFLVVNLSTNLKNTMGRIANFSVGPEIEKPPDLELVSPVNFLSAAPNSIM